MQSDIINKLDVLVDMAGSTSNIDTLQAELIEIEKENANLKSELSLLVSNNLKDKYFKATEKQVDENIKVSLEAKIRKQEKYLGEIQEEISSVSSEESKLHDTIVNIKKEMSSSGEYVNALTERISAMTDTDSLTNYKNILSEENKHIDELASLLNKNETTYSDILEKLNYLDLAKTEIETKLESDRSRLSDTKANLVNPSSYVDEELRQVDEDRIDEIGKQLLELDKRRLEIITDPVMIAEEAKTLIEEDAESALSKVKELVTIVKSKPYMDITTAEVNTILQEELENSSTRRDEFASLIDSKDYTIVDAGVISGRIDSLTNDINDYNSKIQSLSDEIKRLDTEVFVRLNDRLNECIKSSLELEESIKEYEKIIENSEEKTPKRRAILNSAFKKKQKDLENIYMVIESYKRDQKALVKRTHEIEITEIANYEKLINNAQTEIDKLNSILAEVTNTKDVLAIENDKNKLKELDEDVKAIKHRQKYSETPGEIFDEIEIYFGSSSVEDSENMADIQQENLSKSNTPTEEKELNDETVVEEDVLENKEETLSTISIEPVLNEVEFNTLNNDTLESDLEVSDVMQELPTLSNESEENRTFEDNSIELHSEKETEKVSENPFLVANYKDENIENSYNGSSNSDS